MNANFLSQPKSFDASSVQSITDQSAANQSVANQSVAEAPEEQRKPPRDPTAHRYHFPHRNRKCDTTGIGIDKARLVTKEFTVGPSAEFDTKETTNTKTGEMTNKILYEEGGEDSIVRGKFATHYNPLFQVRIYGPTCLTVQANLPKLLRGENVLPVTSRKEFDRAIQKLELLLREDGIDADLFNAKINGLEVCRNIVTEEPLDDYGPAFRELTFPKATREPYDGEGWQWVNGARRMKVYDKGNEQDLNTERLQRVEYELSEPRSVQRHLDVKTVRDLRANFRAVENGYRNAVETLIPEQSDEIEKDPCVGRSVYSELLNALSEEGNQNMKAVTALAGAFLRERGGIEPFIDMLREEKGRQTATRYREKFETISSEIDLLREGQCPISDMKRELREKLLA